MNVGEVRKTAFMLMNEYSNKGAIIPDAKNADYIKKANTYINQAQLELAKDFPIEETYNLPSVPSFTFGAYSYFDLPEDFWKFKRFLADRVERKVDFLDGTQLAVYTPSLGKTLNELQYYKFPARITDLTPPETELELRKDVQEALPYFVASQLMIGEDNVISTQLYNIYVDLVSSSLKTRKLKNKRMRSVMGFF